MGSDDLLVMAMALPPLWIAARLWWSARHAVDELRESCAVPFGPGSAEPLRNAVEMLEPWAGLPASRI